IPSIVTDLVAAMPGAAARAETAAVTARAPAARRAMRCMWLAPSGVERFMAGSVIAPPWPGLVAGLAPAWHSLGLGEVGRESAEPAGRPHTAAAPAAHTAHWGAGAPAHARQSRH